MDVEVNWTGLGSRAFRNLYVRDIYMCSGEDIPSLAEVKEDHEPIRSFAVARLWSAFV